MLLHCVICVYFIHIYILFYFLGGSGRENLVKVHVIFPPLGGKDDEAINMECTFGNEEDVQEFARICEGYLTIDGKKQVRFSDLVQDRIYEVRGGYYNSINQGRQRDQFEFKKLEIETGIAVSNYLKGNCHTHYNVKFTEAGKDKQEIDAVVIPNVLHSGDEGMVGEAYIVECQFNPSVAKAQKLLDLVDLFKKYAPYNAHFKSVKSCIPVLGGRFWNAETIALCKARNVWRVEPSGSSYRVIRPYSTIARRIMKFI